MTAVTPVVLGVGATAARWRAPPVTGARAAAPRGLQLAHPAAVARVEERLAPLAAQVVLPVQQVLPVRQVVLPVRLAVRRVAEAQAAAWRVRRVALAVRRVAEAREVLPVPEEAQRVQPAALPARQEAQRVQPAAQGGAGRVAPNPAAAH